MSRSPLLHIRKFPDEILDLSGHKVLDLVGHLAHLLSELGRRDLKVLAGLLHSLLDLFDIRKAEVHVGDEDGSLLLSLSSLVAAIIDDARIVRDTTTVPGQDLLYVSVPEVSKLTFFNIRS